MENFIDMFGDCIYSLSEKENIIFKFISSNLELVSSITIKELSFKLNVTEYSIKNLCKKLNIDNFNNLQSIVKDLYKDMSYKSTYSSQHCLKLLKNKIDILDEFSIKNLAMLLLKNKNTCFFYTKETKLICSYLVENLRNLNIETSTSSSFNQITKLKNNLIVMILNNPLYTLKNSIDKLDNKNLIILSNKIIKELQEKSSLFIHIENLEVLDNFKSVKLNSLYFTYIDILISKIVEIKNYKK